jgi:arylformamidase
MTHGDDRRVQFDFEVDFSNGGGIQGQGFRLDIDDEDIDDEALAAYIVRDLRLLMVADTRILNKRVIRERHKRAARAGAAAPGADGRTRIDLSHTVEDGMVTYRGLPEPVIADFLTREQSRAQYDPGTEFQIGRIDMCSNTGTYLDSPFHRYAHGDDLAALSLDRLADLDAVRVDVTDTEGRAVDRPMFVPYDIAGKAVLVHTGWDRHWGTDRLTQHRQHDRGRPAGPLGPARRRDPDLRAPDETRCPAGRWLQVHRGARQGQGHGHLPGSRVRDGVHRLTRSSA